MASKTRKPSGVEKKLVGVADVVISAAQKRRDPTLAIPVRSLSNVSFNERKGHLEMGRRKQARSFFNVGMIRLSKSGLSTWSFTASSSAISSSRARSRSFSMSLASCLRK